jgi:hypothetical protein
LLEIDQVNKKVRPYAIRSMRGCHLSWRIEGAEKKEKRQGRGRGCVEELNYEANHSGEAF